MRVHIVCRDTHKTRILPRMATKLAEVARWSIGPTPAKAVDINYWFPYLEWFQWNETLTAAWFTHRDTWAPGNKVKMWDDAAENVTLRLTSARRYLHFLFEHGESRLVVPFIDLDKFRPIRRDRPLTPTVGTAGYVYPGGRKGEHLIEQLAEEMSVVAAGKGWPVTCQEWKWEDLHRFYQSLDVYVVTSMEEGIPAGPLEALACGVPVVIPYDVGLLDDLPDLPGGIERYQAGDYDTLILAVNKVLDTRLKRSELRATVEDTYTLAAWRETHERAFEDLLYPPAPEDEREPASVDNCGIFCVAYGTPSREMAGNLVSSIKRHMPRVPVCVASDSSLDAGEDLFQEQPDLDIGGRIIKIRMYDLVPESWQYVLYLDADTELVADVSVIFDWLADGWELVICKNPDKYHVLSMMTRPDNREETDYTFQVVRGQDLLQLNGGVLAFRRTPRVATFFKLWMEEWNRYGARDQAALHRALWRRPLKTLVLGNQWNTVIHYDDAETSAGILHYPQTARRWSGRVPGRLDDKSAWELVNVG